MANRTSNTKQRPCRARQGYTLVECMLASTLLCVTVVAVSGAISASYAQDEFAAQRQKALATASQLLDEVTALPIDAASVNDPSIMKYNSYSDQTAAGALASVVSAAANTVAHAAGTSSTNSTEDATRRVTVQRKSALNAASGSTGDFAIVGVAVENGGESVTIKRLVTAAEADAAN